MARPKSTSRYLNQIKINQSISQGKNEKSHLLSGKGQSGMSSDNKLYFMTTNDFSDAASYFNLCSLF